MLIFGAQAPCCEEAQAATWKGPLYVSWPLPQLTASISCRHVSKRAFRRLQLPFFFLFWPSPWASQVVLVVKNPPTNAGDLKRLEFDPWVRRIHWGRAWQPTPLFLPGESHGQRSLAGYSPWGRKESDMTEATWHARVAVKAQSPIHWTARGVPSAPYLQVTPDMNCSH